MLKILSGVLFVLVIFYYFFQKSKKIFPVFVPMPYPEFHIKNHGGFEKRKKKKVEKKRNKPIIKEKSINPPQELEPPQNLSIEPIQKDYHIVCKQPGQITPEEYQVLQIFWNHLREHSFFQEGDMGLKDNAVVFLAYSTEGYVIAQCNIFVLD